MDVTGLAPVTNPSKGDNRTLTMKSLPSVYMGQPGEPALMLGVECSLSVKKYGFTALRLGAGTE